MITVSVMKELSSYISGFWGLEIAGKWYFSKEYSRIQHRVFNQLAPLFCDSMLRISQNSQKSKPPSFPFTFSKYLTRLRYDLWKFFAVVSKVDQRPV